MKLHVGCGSVFLRDWVNVDLPRPNVFLAKERPDLVEKFITDESDYYGRHREKNRDIWRKGPITEETACDAFGSFDFLPARDRSVTELLTRQCFEHLAVDRARAAFAECKRVMAYGGHLRIDVPDPEATLEKYRETGDDFYKRHLFGPRKDQYGFHSFYDRRSLAQLGAAAGFNLFGEEENIHDYPAFCIRFVLS